MFSRKKRIATEICQATCLGLDEDWKKIAGELVRVRASSDPGNSRSAMLEFHAASNRVAEVLSARFSRFLSLCKSHSVSPPDVIDASVDGLRDLIGYLRAYGNERIVGVAPFGSSNWVSRQVNDAVASAERSLQQGRSLALQGYAGNDLIFPRYAWPKRWWSKLPRLAAWLVAVSSRWVFRLTGH